MAICALQQALKVAYSDKVPSESRTWVAAYTATVLSQLLQLQTDPQTLCTVIIGVFQQTADAQTQIEHQGLAAAHTVDKTGSPPAQHATAGLNSDHAEHAGVLLLPKEAQTLVSLYSLAISVMHKWQLKSARGMPVAKSDSTADALCASTSQPASSGKKRKKDRQAATERSAKKQRAVIEDQAVNAEVVEGLQVWAVPCQKGNVGVLSALYAWLSFPNLDMSHDEMYACSCCASSKVVQCRQTRKDHQSRDTRLAITPSVEQKFQLCDMRL